MIYDDYAEKNCPGIIFLDAAQHPAEKIFFCVLKCSQTLKCLQMADQRSTEMFAFKLAGGTFAHKRDGSAELCWQLKLHRRARGPSCQGLSK